MIWWLLFGIYFIISFIYVGKRFTKTCNKDCSFCWTAFLHGFLSFPFYLIIDCIKFINLKRVPRKELLSQIEEYKNTIYIIDEDNKCLKKEKLIYEKAISDYKNRLKDYEQKLEEYTVNEINNPSRKIYIVGE